MTLTLTVHLHWFPLIMKASSKGGLLKFLFTRRDLELIAPYSSKGPNQYITTKDSPRTLRDRINGDTPVNELIAY